MEANTYLDVIIFFVKSFVINFSVYYSFNKITANTEKRLIGVKRFLLCNFLIMIPYTFLEFKANSILYAIIMYFLLAVLLGKITNNKFGYSIIATLIAYAICNIAMLISVVINFLIYHFIYDSNSNLLLSSVSILAVQFLLVYLFFRIKRFRKGFDTIYRKFSKDMVDTIVVYISLAVLLISCLIGSLFQNVIEMAGNLLIVFIILGITMFVMIQRTISMQYRQTQLLKTLDEYKQELEEKDKTIEVLSKEKFNTSKIRHEFYHRQQALELLVKENMNSNSDISKKDVNKNILDIIEKLSNEYREECEKVKQLPELKKTGIIEIDSMFKYMQNECAKHGIEFKLKIIGEIYPLVNNIITKSKLETMIGDHIKDAINAINNENIANKEILVILGKKDKKYELAIHDTGVEFEIDTLLKLGKEKTTTNSHKGGTGIGFLTTFETLKETKASLIITENKPDEKRYYTKSVTIRFDGKKEYKIVSYRANDIENKNKDGRMLIEKI